MTRVRWQTRKTADTKTTADDYVKDGIADAEAFLAAEAGVLV